MSDRSPVVSVITPTYNRAGFVCEAVHSCLIQFDPPHRVEVILVDDGSTDDTQSRLMAFGSEVRVISLSTNHGRNRARNTGLAAVRGTYVKFLDSDDVLELGSLRLELNVADETRAEVVISGGQYVGIGDTAATRSPIIFDAPLMEPVIDSLLAGRAIPTSAGLYSREMLGDLRWDEQLRKLDDWDWFIRAALHAKKIARADTIAYSWRQHATQGIRSETMLRNAREHHAILNKLEEALAERGELTRERQKRLAQYFYKEMRVLSLCDKPGFEWGVRHIYQLDSNFVPRDEERQWWMRGACRFLGVRAALSMHSTAKRYIKGTSR